MSTALVRAPTQALVRQTRKLRRVCKKERRALDVGMAAGVSARDFLGSFTSMEMAMFRFALRYLGWT